MMFVGDEPTAMIRTHLALLGSLYLSVEGQPFTLVSTPITSLLGYLALHATQGRAVARVTLAGRLWPNLSEKRARNTLNDTLYRLRRTLDTSSWLYVDSSSMRLVNVSVDVEMFKAAAASRHLADRKSALDLYSGDLLENLDADWLLVPRISLQDLYLNTLGSLCTALTDAGQLAEALAYAHRWVLTDPYNEDAHRMVMRLAMRLGQHAAALRQYDRLVHLLEEEFQTAPLLETRALANVIRTESYAVPDTTPVQPTFVGRRAERAALLHYAEQAQQGYGRVILVEGEAGIGKTGLLEALAEGASWRGMQVIWARAQRDEPSSHYAPIPEVIGTAILGAHAEQIHAQLPIATAQLLPELIHSHDRFKGETHSVGTAHHSSPLQGTHHLPALAAFSDVIQVLSDTHPYLIILEDLQWAGANFWPAIQACASKLHQQRVLIVLCYRGADLRNNQVAWGGLQTLDRALAPSRFLLHGLIADDCVDMAQAFGLSITPETAIALHQQTGGNPLFIRELLVARRDQQNSEMTLALLDNELAHPLPVESDIPTSSSAEGRVLETDAHTTFHASPSSLIVQLARADAPLGRSLSAEERISVRWTVDAGESDMLIYRNLGKVALRRHRIARLIEEAHNQGGMPTDLDLARALDVTERTLITDMAALRATGHLLTTRRRKIT